MDKIRLSELEKEKNFSLNRILQEIEAITNQRITQNCLLFLDEIQECPTAISKLRYFYEEMPHLPVIAAGSLLEFVLNDHKFSIETLMVKGVSSFLDRPQAISPFQSAFKNSW